ncbi:class I SAM-dependent methyltransferase [Billgrantia zhangzhouensis]|uniref:class I SAM-dependent methyltransferase n=1 Tax=Billgrantia zhangzhouensis TaxID=2733481 RepID=UPI001F492D9A
MKIDNRYGSLAAWVYDLDKPIGRSFGDIEFYGRQLEGCSGAILEPAVGNGRIFIPLLEQGLRMVGFDASEEMLVRCQEHCASRELTAVLSHQRFEAFHYSERFEAIIVPAGSFQLLNFEQARVTLLRFHEHLMPDGRLLLDLDAADSLIEDKGGQRSWPVGESELLTLAASPPEVDYLAQRTHALLRYEHWVEGRLVLSELERFSLRWWGLQELTLLLEQLGFTHVRLYGDYSEEPPRQGCQMITVEARR